MTEHVHLVQMMAHAATLLAWIITLPFVVVTLYLCFEIVCGLKTLPARTFAAPVNPDIAVLLPAHNEAYGIADTVHALRSALPQARLLVVADNCTDDTASLAATAGAEVIERYDLEKRGKGFALDFGRQHLRLNPPDAVITIDADCRLAAGSGELLAYGAIGLNRAVQATNLLVSPVDMNPLEGISNFAFLVKNLVRARGLMRIGRGIPLFGTGMAFPWTLFSHLKLASDALAEDLELGLNLAKDGVRVEFLDQALVTSPAASAAQNREQRKRWEGGFLSQAKTFALPLIGLGIKRRSRHLLGLGAHMFVPPIALLVLWGIAVAIVTATLALIAQSAVPFIVTCCCLCVLMILLFAVWIKEGRQVLSFSSLARAPKYVIWKIPIYLGFVRQEQVGWKRTHRPDEPPN